MIEPDVGGQQVLTWLAKSQIRDRVHLLHLHRLTGAKDPSEPHGQDPGTFFDRWKSAIEQARPWSEVETEQAQAEIEQAWQHCASLAKKDRILDHAYRVLYRLGIIGEKRHSKLLYLIVTSRLFDRPVSAAIKGPSSAGKSFMVEQNLKLFPPEAHYGLSSMSERALAYSDEPLVHRVLVLYEAAGLHGELMTYFVRSLLSEGRIRYETVEKTSEGMQPRLIEREGPTGLLITTTAIRLHAENETRFFSIPVTDTKAQTRAILRALARERRGDVPDVTTWHALQHWLSHGEHRVTMPFADALVEKIPPVAVRLRRDIRAVLTLIRAHALLHRATRSRDEHGQIVATLDDYRVVRDLVGKLLAEGIGASVSEPVRETVAALAELVPSYDPEDKQAVGASLSQVAKALKLDKSTVSRRVRMAVEAGFLTNLETKRGRPARLVVGDPVPDELEILPPVEALEQCCSVAGVAPINGIHTPLPPCLESVPSESPDVLDDHKEVAVPSRSLNGVAPREKVEIPVDDCLVIYGSEEST